MKKKILIIGLGNMGKAHLQSFINKNYIIDVVEKKKPTQELLKKNNIFFFKQIPENQSYLLTISATQSKERFSLIRKFFETNSTEFLLLEKFCFYSIQQFIKFKNKYNLKTNTFVNSWAYIIANKLKIFNEFKTFQLNCEIREGNLLSNISHIFHMFGYINKYKKIKKFYNSDYKIIKSLKKKNYNELVGSIKFSDIDKNLLKINTKRNMSNIMNFYIRQKKSKTFYKISITKENKIYYFKNKKIIKIINFPLSKKTSFLFLKNCLNKKFNYMPSFLHDYKFSKNILNFLKAKIA
jgi:hypothetical protein